MSSPSSHDEAEVYVVKVKQRLGQYSADSTTKSKLRILTLEEVETLLRKGSFRIIPNPFSKSETAVWKKFGLLQLEDSSKPLPYAACRNCQKVYPYNSSHSSGTSTLKRHLQEYCFTEMTQ
ncbi:hypothetical protein BV898_08268 [Hypsibius exemplaris]|uniref:BED-type domain-containing protein n=1 Tax=Hypsibius exemplaris TaxID=2072580 RepID=A0A1W0WR16_HYPEX|nr:hypothetical protein BV898_08268 [Hypsibius exemplaris]